MLLILIYRSPLFFWIPLIAVGFAEITTRAVGYGLTELGVTVNGQSSSILSVLVLGAGTDYALLLVSRYREELRKHEDKHEAVALAMRTAGPAIFASGCTVIAALLCLSIAQVEGTAGLGPIGAMGIAVAMITMLTLLPAMLAITGRGAFWRPPMFGWSNGVPHFGDTGADETHGTWRKVGNRVAAQPAPRVDRHRGDADRDGARPPDHRHRPHAERRLPREGRVDRGAGAAVAVLPRRRQRGDRDHRPRSRRRGGGHRRRRGLRRRRRGASRHRGRRRRAAQRRARARPVLDRGLRPRSRTCARRVKEAGGQDVLVGGPSAIEHDVRKAAARDTLLIPPIALFVVLLILIALLRASSPRCC